jgi:hypothetical protein
VNIFVAVEDVAIICSETTGGSKAKFVQRVQVRLVCVPGYQLVGVTSSNVLTGMWDLLLEHRSRMCSHIIDRYCHLVTGFYSEELLLKAFLCSNGIWT